MVMFVDSASRLQRPYGASEKSRAAIFYVVKYLKADMGVPRAFRTDNGTEYSNSMPGYIDTIPTIYIFIRHLQHQDIDGHLVTCCDYIYILCGHTYIMNVTDRQFFWRSPSTARTRTIH